MSGLKKLLYSMCVVSLGGGAALADTSAGATASSAPAPVTLRMRPNAPSRAVRVADNTPPPDTAPPSPPPASPAPTGDATAAPPADAPTSAAAANVAATPDMNDAELQKMAEDAAAKNTEIVVVTGSLIARKKVAEASPVAVLDREQLDAAGITGPGDILQKLPAQGNAINSQVNNGGDGSTRVSLRSLGSNRTLTLINGRRVVPGGTGADDSVDINAIPLAVIDRVEVLKDGASAIYGSDAIAGVVNIITRQDLQGTEVSAYTSTSQRGDGTNYDLSVVTGHTSNRGNVMLAVGYQRQGSISANDRDWSKTTSVYNYADGTTKLSGSVDNPTGRLNTAGVMGVNGGNPITVPGCTSQYCTANGTGGFRNYIDPTATSFHDNYNFQPLNYLLTPSTRINLFSTGHYDLTSNTKVFFEASYNNRKSTQQLAPTPFDAGEFGTPISADSIYNPLGQDIVDYTRRLTEFGDRVSSQNIQTFRTVVGLSGKIPDDAPAFRNWRWEASFNYGRTDATQSSTGNIILSHLANALGPSFRDASGTPTCGTADAPIAGCVPLNLLVPGQVTPAMINYLTFTGVNSGFNDQRTTSLQASGQLIKLPNGGDLSLAVGGDYRHEQGGTTPDPLTATGDTTGNAAAPTEGSYHVFEGYGELSLVPISGKQFAQWVELDAAGRVFDYNNFGSGTTYKVSGLWKTAGGVSLRGTYGTAFRAPNVGELFLGKADSFPTLVDPCDVTGGGAGMKTLDGPTAAECKKEGVPPNAAFGTTQQRATVGGNTALTPETAKIGTTGIVWEPAKGLALTLDYWNIEIDNTINAVNVNIIANNCYEHSLQSFCADITRDPITHRINRINDIEQNLGTTNTSGLDLSGSYIYNTPVGTFRHEIDATYLFKYNLDQGGLDANNQPAVIHGRGNYDLGVNPDLKFNVLTTYRHPSGIGGGFSLRFIDSFHECQDDDCNDEPTLRREVGKYITGDLFADYAFKSSAGKTTVSVGVNNFIDANPPVIYNAAGLNEDASAYDFLGRMFYARLSHLF